MVSTASWGTGLKVRTLALEISWASVTEPVEPTNPNASCLGTPFALSQLVDGYRPAAAEGSGPVRVRVVCPTGVKTTLYVPASTETPESEVNAETVGLMSTWTGTADASRVAARKMTLDAGVPL